jgi:hypothetical protein
MVISASMDADFPITHYESYFSQELASFHPWWLSHV